MLFTIQYVNTFYCFSSKSVVLKKGLDNFIFP
uniref:Uncharacterized protein n=1 Tax=Anguilla anguilla TaxID=7936 RepID=A0A0E9V759_ANGAN